MRPVIACRCTKGRAYEGLVIDRRDFSIAHNDVGDPSFDWAIDLVE